MGIVSVIVWLSNWMEKLWTLSILLAHSILLSFFGTSAVQKFYKYFDYLFLLCINNSSKVRRQEYSSIVASSPTATETELDLLVTLIWIPHQFLVYSMNFIALQFIYQELVRGYKLLKQFSLIIRELTNRSHRNRNSSRSRSPDRSLHPSPNGKIESTIESDAIESAIESDVIESIKLKHPRQFFITQKSSPKNNPFEHLFVTPRDHSSHSVDTDYSPSPSPFPSSSLSPAPAPLRKPKSSLLKRFSSKSMKMKTFWGRLSLRGKSKSTL
ncbi:hypothetical protein K7432_001921 [Basidiobolus ranarum]|uniref:Uncharacterized protein n=1 Tax=Basidiobolus ranarum TaxID=34480 RepID=A0ABR2W8U2_9FUNG